MVSAQDLRQWATNRGQTLSRTVDGMMLYERALKVLAKQEEPGSIPVVAITSCAH